MKAQHFVTSRPSGDLLAEKAEVLFADWEEKLPPFAEFGRHPGDLEANQIRLYPEVEYQTVSGFGGAFSESAAVAWLALPKEEQDALIRAYFSKEEGIGYSFCRVPMGSCDFSVEAYTYVKDGDMTLASFDVSREDVTIFRMILAAKAYEENLTLFASPWTPPPYMKDNGEWQGGKLKAECAALWAKYYGKYVEACRARGIEISAFTVQNEPRHHQMWESCCYTAEEEMAFVREHLAPVLAPLGVKIYIFDHCKERVFERATLAFTDPTLRDAVAGVAFHTYSGDHFEELRMVRERYFGKELIMSETCYALPNPAYSPDRQWAAVLHYTHDIIGNLANGMTAFCDWNLVLDEERGPFHFREGRGCVADAPVIADKKQGKAILQPSYYAIGQFSRFIRPGARVIGLSKPWADIEAVAAKNTDGSIALVMRNPRPSEHTFFIHIGAHLATAKIPPYSLNTFVIKE